MKPFDVLNSLHDVLCNLDKSPLHSSWRFQCGFLSPSWPLYHKLLGRYLMFYVTAGCRQTHSIQSLRCSIYQPCICIKHCFSCSISPLSTSDHLWILVTNKLPTTNKRPRFARRTVWCYSQGDFEKACKMLDMQCWLGPTTWWTWYGPLLADMAIHLSEYYKQMHFLLSSSSNLNSLDQSLYLAVKQSSEETPSLRPTLSSFKLLQIKFITNRIVSEVSRQNFSSLSNFKQFMRKHFENCLSCLPERNPLLLLY